MSMMSPSPARRRTTRSPTAAEAGDLAAGAAGGRVLLDCRGRWRGLATTGGVSCGFTMTGGSPGRHGEERQRRSHPEGLMTSLCRLGGFAGLPRPLARPRNDQICVREMRLEWRSIRQNTPSAILPHDALKALYRRLVERGKGSTRWRSSPAPASSSSSPIPSSPPAPHGSSSPSFLRDCYALLGLLGAVSFISSHSHSGDDASGP